MDKEKFIDLKVFRILVSFLLGSIISLSIHISNTYVAESKINDDTKLNFTFIYKVTETFYSSIITSIKMFFILPIFLFIPILYVLFIYKIYKSKNYFFIKYSIIILTAAFVFIHIITFNFLSFLVM